MVVRNEGSVYSEEVGSVWSEFLSIRPIAKEQLSIGLFMSDGERVLFHFSHEKLNFTKKLLSDNTFAMLKGYLEGLNHDINIGGNKHLKNISQDYFNYLANYNNNLISFSKPISINIDLSQGSFEQLFEKFVFNYEKQPISINISKERTIEIARKELHPKIEKHVNWNKTLTPTEIPSLFIPKIKIDFIGRNDLPVAGEAINFETGSTVLSNNLGRFISLIKAFDIEKEAGKFFVLGDEPSKVNFPEQHSTWKHLFDSQMVEIVPLNETERISEYMDEHKVRPFIAE